MSFAQGAPTQPLVLQGSNVFLYGSSTAGNAFTVQQLGVGNVASFVTSTGATSLFINPSGNVGIGTATPQYRLHVVNPGPLSNIVIETDTNAVGQRSEIRFGIPAFSGTAKRAGITSNTYTADASDLQFWTNAASGTASAPQMTILPSGYVGIGIVSPTAPLHVVSSQTSSGNMVILDGSSQSTVDTGIRINSGSGKNPYIDWIQNGTAKCNMYWDNANSVMRINGQTTNSMFSGNVGVGITNPGYPLVVYGSNTAYQFTISSYNSSLDFNCGTRFGTLSPGFTTIDPNGGSPQGLGIWDHLAINGTCAIGAGYAQTAPSPANSLIVAGNIGIGTASPGRRLHVYDAATSGAGPFVVDQFAASGFTDTVTLFRGAQAASSAWSICFMQSNSGGNNLFYVRGDGYVWAANDITAFSDERVKTNLKKIEGALDKVSNINGYTFTRTDYTNEDDRDKRHVGVIAQEIQKVLPELVHEDDKGMLSVAYGNMTALLVEALKEERAARLVLEERLVRLEKLLLKE